MPKPTPQKSPPQTAQRAAAEFDSLTDSAMVPIRTMAIQLTIDMTTARRIAHSDPRLQLTHYPGFPRMTRVNVGGLRAYMRGEGAAK